MKVNKTNYWIASQLFYPNETSTAFVMTKIAEYVLNLGNVNVICGPSNYQSDALNNAHGLDDRIVIHKINAPALNKNNLFFRLIAAIILSFKISWKILFKVKSTDSLILVTNPPVLILLVTLIKRFKKFKMYILVHDVFPENLVATGIVKQSSIIYKILLTCFNTAYNQTDYIITCGADMKNVFLEKVNNVPISVVTNWADNLEVFKKENYNIGGYYKLDLTNKIVIQFAGNIGRAQGLDKFLEVFSTVNNPNLFLIILGDGAFKDKLVAYKKEHNLQNVAFFPSVSRMEQNDFLNACDIGLVTLSEGMYGLGVPSKVYNIFSAGRPVLYIGDYGSEIYNYINKYNIGWAFTWGNKNAIRVFLEELTIEKRKELTEKGDAARRVVDAVFNKEYVLEQYGKIFSN